MHIGIDLNLARWHASAVAAALALALSACGNARSLRTAMPASFGMTQAAVGVYVEPTMPAADREALLRDIEAGKQQARRFYGTLIADPMVVACATLECAQRFGSYGEPAAALGGFAIRLSPNSRGRVVPIIAHEWSHCELYHRAGGWWHIRKVPRWFDEGLAVAIADEPRHSEDNWREIQRRGLPTPALSALKSFKDWNLALQKYGETQLDNRDNLRVVYSRAGHEVRGWLLRAGPSGLDQLLIALANGEAFDAAYARIGMQR